ncbi:DUF6093 family protein [Streptomyces sp. NPDC002758]
MSALEAVLAAGRREHEAIMLDTVRIWRPGPAVFDRSTGTTASGAPVELYAGKARVKPFGRSASTGVEAGEREVVVREYVVSLPFSALPAGGETVLAGDQVQVTASADPRLTDRTLWVSVSQLNAQATAWRINAEDRS